MIKILMIIVSTVLLGLVITYSWFNRDSDRVLLTLITAMTIGVVGFITKESISNKVEEVSEDFTVVVFYGKPNYKPLNINLPYFSDLLGCLQNVVPTDFPNKEDNNNLDIGYAAKKYFDALQYSIIISIFQNFNQGWNVQAKTTITPNGRTISWHSEDDEGQVITLEEILEEIPNNYFFSNSIYPSSHGSFGNKAIFPKGTSIEIIESDSNSEFKLRLTNKYISIVIILRISSSSLGIGEYARFLGQKEPAKDIVGLAEEGLGNSVYFLSIDLKQNYWLNGHPEMKKHRDWANSIMTLLKTKFSYELIREQHIQDFQLHGPSGITVYPI